MFSAYYTVIPEEMRWESCADALLKLISPERASLISRKSNTEKLLESLAATRLFEQKASFITGVPISDLTYKYGEKGKPELGFDSEISFSLSHAKGLVAVVINYNEDRGPAPSCGIDCEDIPSALIKAEEHMKLAERFFGEGELGYIGCAEGTDRAARFLEVWTAKEAHAKLTGKGIFGEISCKDLFVPKDSGEHIYSDGLHLTVFKTSDAVISVAVDEPRESMPYDILEVPFEDLFKERKLPFWMMRDSKQLDNDLYF